MVDANVYSNIGFYVGDISFVLNPKIYCAVFMSNGCKDGVYAINGYSIAVGATVKRDGTVIDNNGFEYRVDAANIGIVPIELIECGENVCGRLFCVPGEADFICDSGIFRISLPSDDEIIIDTRY